MTADPSSLVAGAQSLGELLVARRRSEGDSIRFVTDVRPGFTERGEASELVSREALFEEAARAATALVERGVVAGDRVLLLIPRPRDFLRCFFACQLVGAIPVPLVPPWSLSRMRAHVERIVGVVRICRPKVTVADRDALVAMKAFAKEDANQLSFGELLTPAELDAPRELETVHRPAPSDTALIQFTSGSTKEPRGVQLCHSALLSNCYAIGRSLGFDRPGHLGVSWLPLFHDMGLIGHVLVPLVWGIPTVLMPPESFALRPISWLQAIAGFGATISTAPNFAYQLVAEKLPPEKTRELDLSRWTVALCGGEPVLPQSLDRFAERFSSNGFEARALCPVYGLAEATLAVTLSTPSDPPRVEKVERRQFTEHGRATLDRSPDALSIVSCGGPPRGHRIEIRDSSGKLCDEGREGDIWVTGPSLMTGYFRDTEATRACLVDGWLATGDRGYTRDGELYVTGRAKELILKGGRNLYPQEIEAAAGRVDGIRMGRIAAFGIPDALEGTDRLVVAAEYQKDTSPREELERAVLEAVTTAVGVRPDEVVLLPPGTLTKTSSGKMQRLEAQKRYLQDALDQSHPRLTDAARLLLARARLRLSGR